MVSPYLFKLPGLDEAAEVLNERFPPTADLIPSDLEFENAHLAPPCIVENYLWEDVGLLFAPGGTGKTTLIVFEAICIALGRPLWGLEVISPGKTMIISAEDSRMILLARIRSICKALNLSEDEIRCVKNSVLVLDVSTKFVKLIEDSTNKGITISSDVTSICNAYSNQNIKVVVIDPAISFGISESKINDNEQGLIMAGRALVRGLGACVRYIHHTGKSGVDKDRPQTQYSGRGGSAFADGSRMVAGISSSDKSQLPMGVKTGPNASVLLLSRHKLTYSQKQPEILVIRDGYEFSYALRDLKNQDEINGSQKRQLQNWIYQAERSRNLYLTKTAIEDGYLKEIGITKATFRSVLAQLQSEQIVIDLPIPETLKHGARCKYLHARFDSSISGVEPIEINDHKK